MMVKKPIFWQEKPSSLYKLKVLEEMLADGLNRKIFIVTRRR